MKTRISLALFVVLSCNSVFGQQLVKGKVKDRGSKEPIGYCAVVEEGTSNGVFTDFDGDFALKVGKVPATIRFKAVGYSEFTLLVTEISTEPIQIELDFASTGPIIDIVDSRITEKQKQNPLTVERLDLTAIKNAASGNFYESLGTLKGVDLTTASLGFRVINTRGFNSTSPVRSLQLIDGVDNQSPGLNFSLGNFLGAPDLDVVGVDIVQGASSAFFGPGAFNGVVKMETKNPFDFPGLTAQVRVGERKLVEPSVRFAHVFRNKMDEPFLAYKFNVFAFSALDWAADNYNPVYNTEYGVQNAGGFNAVNIYGDEYFPANDFSGDLNGKPGMGVFFRNGYRESDVVDYNTKNVKANAVAHWRLKPELKENSPEIIFAANVGQGTTVYQGDNRFSLRDILFYQGRIELKKENDYFIRIYGTGEDAGRSYDPYFTSLKLLDEARSNELWANVYVKYWKDSIQNRVLDMGYPQYVQNPNWPQEPNFYIVPTQDQYQQWFTDHYDSLLYYHQLVQNWTNTGNANIPSVNGIGFFQPGTDIFNQNFDRITAGKNNDVENGTRFFDRSKLFHIHGEKQFETNGYEIRIGANGRMYKPFSDGTIFEDDINRITNIEGGAYAGVSKKYWENKLVASVTARADKNQNFDLLFSPAASLVYKSERNDYFRISFSSALRNPTLTDQYLNLNVGPAILSGNLNGVDSLITLESFSDYRYSLSTDDIRYFNINPIRPEQVRTFELGYRGFFMDQKLYVDAGAYYSRYNHFIGYNIGIEADFDALTGLMNDFQVYRYSANSTSIVTTQGLNLGVNYYYHKKHSFSGNYSFNAIASQDESDPIIPAFNTPKHKFNLGLNGSKLFELESGGTFGYSVNYKWIQGFLFEGSPQFTGVIPTYDLVDFQLNYSHGKEGNWYAKIGASNVLNNLQVQAYGGPRIGRLAYLSLTYNFNHQEKIKNQ